MYGYNSTPTVRQVTTSIASYIGHDPAHAMDSVHAVSTLFGGWIGAVTLTGAPCSSSHRVFAVSNTLILMLLVALLDAVFNALVV